MMSSSTGGVSSANSSIPATTVCQYEPAEPAEPEIIGAYSFSLSVTLFDYEVSQYQRKHSFVFFDDAGNILSPSAGQLVFEDTTDVTVSD